MTLEPNTPLEKIEVFKIYEGENVKRMPDLIGDGRVPMNFARIMRRRLDVLDSAFPENVRDWWWTNTVYSGDGARRSPDGKLKIAYDSATLRGINPGSALSGGVLTLTPEQYAAGDGPEFTSEQVAKYTGRFHDGVEFRTGERAFFNLAMQNPIYVDGLARGDRQLAREYAQAVFTLGKQRFRYDEALGIYAPHVQNRHVELLWYAGPLGTDDRCSARGDIVLDNYYGLLVGEAPEASAARDQTHLETLTTK